MKFESVHIEFQGRQYTICDYYAFKDTYKDSPAAKTLLLMKRSPSLLFAIMMLLERHIPYIPVDPTYPHDRIQFIAEQSGAAAIIGDSSVQGGVRLKPDAMAEDFRDIAYILFTSGTTGKPKGVEITRTALAGFMEGVAERIRFQPGRRIACLTTVSFDIFFLESIMALYYGLTVVLGNEQESANARKLVRFLNESQVDMLQITPSRLQMLLHEDPDLRCLDGVKDIMVGGEALPNNLLKVLQQKTDARIFNMYGPTETTIWSTIGELTASQSVDIGTPIRGTNIYIMDEVGTVLPDGEIGEIVIGGKGLALGYVGREDLTAERFVYRQTGISTLERVYLTGDLGRRLSNGRYECLGRLDNQVKIHGFRIEPEEIEAHMNQFPGILRSIVKAEKTPGGSETLAAFYISGRDIDVPSLVSYLSERLPPYMIPIRFRQVRSFPYTVNGKVDRAALSAHMAMTNEVTSDTELSVIQEKALDIVRAQLDDTVYGMVRPDSELSIVGIDSLTFILILTSLESAFSFQFEEEKMMMSAFPKIKSLLEYVEERQTSQPDRTMM